MFRSENIYDLSLSNSHTNQWPANVVSSGDFLFSELFITGENRTITTINTTNRAVHAPSSACRQSMILPDGMSPIDEVDD
jgi:hypothetical protein